METSIQDGWKCAKKKVDDEDDEDGSRGEETLDLNAVHSIDEEKITITIGSRAAVSVMPKNVLADVPKKRRNREQVVLSGQRIRDTRSWRQEDHVQIEERVHAVDELSTGGRDQSVGIGERNLPEEDKVVFDEEGSYIENKASGRKVPMRVEHGVYVIDVHVKDLIDTRGPIFFGAG